MNDCIRNPLRLTYPIEIFHSDGVPVAVGDSAGQRGGNVGRRTTQTERKHHDVIHNFESHEIVTLIIAPVVQQKPILFHSGKAKRTF